jgi:hypothetical protein
MLVDDLERDLGRGAVADEPRDPGRLRIPVDVRHEDVTVAVDACERRQLGLGQPRLRAAEAVLPGAIA